MRLLYLLEFAGLAVAFENLLSIGQYNTADDSWRRAAIEKLWDERKQMVYTPLFKFSYPGNPQTDLIFKNETASRSDTLKHRYAWALVMWALIQRNIGPDTNVFEASSGNTAASLAYMCRLIGVNFTAVVPDTLELNKAHHILQYGANLRQVPNLERWMTARQIAAAENGFFMNQFGNADKAEEFHDSGSFPLESVNIYHEFLRQLAADPRQLVKEPHFFVMPAGTGGTISSVGKYVKRYGVRTKIVLADTQYSLYGDYVLNGRFKNESGEHFVVAPGIAGVGTLPTGQAIFGTTTSLNPGVIDRVMKIPDLASTAAVAVLHRLGINAGITTAVSFLGMLSTAAREATSTPAGERLTIASVLADPGNFYESSYLNRSWIADKFEPHGGLQAYDCWRSVIEYALQSGGDPLELGTQRCQSEALFSEIELL